MKGESRLRKVEKVLEQLIEIEKAKNRIVTFSAVPGKERIYFTASGRKMTQEEFDREKPEMAKGKIYYWDSDLDFSGKKKT